MSVPEPIEIKRWRLRFASDVRLDIEVNAQPNHVAFNVTEYGYAEESRLGLCRGGTPFEMRKVADAFRQLANTMDAACEDAEARAPKEKARDPLNIITRVEKSRPIG